MKNDKKQDDITVNVVRRPNDVESTSRKPATNSQDTFCIYAGQKHAVGSIIKDKDQTVMVCSEDGSWQNI